MRDSDNHASLAKRTVKKDRKALLSGVLVLALAGVFVKVFGFLYKVPLNTILGDDMANVNTAYSIYATLLVISTAGIPSAVAMLISKSRVNGDEGRVKATFDVAFSFLVSAGVLLTFLMLIFAKALSSNNSDGDSYLCMLAIAPSLFFVCAISVYRGYFQGFQIMTPTAVSEIIEAMGKTVFGLAFAIIATRVFSLSTVFAAALSVLGISLGMGFSLLYLIIALPHYRRRGLLAVEKTVSGERLKRGRILLEILKISVPIAISSAVISVASLVDAQFMRPLLAEYTGDPTLAKAVYSDYSTGAVTLFNLPSTLIYPIACAIIPFITASITAEDRRAVREVSESSFRLASVISLPCALSLSLLSGELLSLIFRGDESMGENAGPLLALLAPAIFFIGILAVSNAVLQAHGKASRPIISMLAGLLVKVVSSFMLIRRFGAVGTPISTLLFYAVTACINMLFVMRELGSLPSVRGVLLRPLLCAAVSALLAKGVASFALSLGNTVSVMLAVLVGVCTYVPLVFMLKCISREDLTHMPKAERIIPMLEKLRLIK